MKMTKKKSYILLLVFLSSIGVIWLCYHTYEKQYYRQFTHYSGKAKIDDYEMIADGAVLLLTGNQLILMKIKRRRSMEVL